MSLVARRVRPDIKIVVRVFSDVLADRLADIFGIRAVYSTSGLASPTLTAAALIGGVEHGFALGNRLIVSEQVTITITSRLHLMHVGAIRTQHSLIVLDVQREGVSVVLPTADEQLIAEDRVTLLGPLEALLRMR
jgi:hypothetical protein